MIKILRVARLEYTRMVVRRSFIISTLAVPLMIFVVVAISIFFSTGGSNGRETTVGYVDLAGITTAAPAITTADPTFEPYASVELAQAALADGDILAYYVIPADYKSTGRVELDYWERQPGDTVSDAFNRFLRAHLLADQSDIVQQRVRGGINLTIQSTGGRSGGEENFLNFLLPFFVGLLFVFIVMGSSGLLLQAVTTEKENRTVEVLFTSLSPTQLILGKVIGLMAVALTQVGLWLGVLIIGILIAENYLHFLGALSIPGGFLLLLALFFLVTYALVAGIMITIGSMVTELQQAQQIAGFVNLLFLAPFFVLVLVFSNPNSPLLVAMTLFPTTSFMTIAMRWGVTDIPAWQIVGGFVSITATAVLAVWVAARVFRSGMLQYGQPLNFQTLSTLVRSGGR